VIKEKTMQVIKPLLLAAAGLAALVACGSNAAQGSSPAAAPPAGTTVAVKSVGGVGNALVDSAGMTLYMTDQDTATKIACDNKACTTVWKPLTVTGGQQPTGPSDLSGKLTTVHRPDGLTQVAFDGKPLYTFAEDSAAGQANGNGATDSFGGPMLTWHALTASGTAAAVPDDSSQPPNNYGY
jgi:predicted lipoprotein with Yx(FWY)xxD motif